MLQRTLEIMAYIHPFMQRRGDNFYFRIQVPVELRQMVDQREFTRTLKTGDRAKAVSLALKLGSVAKHLQAARDNSRSTTSSLNTFTLAHRHADDGTPPDLPQLRSRFSGGKINYFFVRGDAFFSTQVLLTSSQSCVR